MSCCLTFDVLLIDFVLFCVLRYCVTWCLVVLMFVVCIWFEFWCFVSVWCGVVILFRYSLSCRLRLMVWFLIYCCLDDVLFIMFSGEWWFCLLWVTCYLFGLCLFDDYLLLILAVCGYLMVVVDFCWFS